MRKAIQSLVLVFATAAACLAAESLPLPNRQSNALSGSALTEEVSRLDIAQREARLLREILDGNVPGFLRTLRPVHLNAVIDGREVQSEIEVAPDYLAAGSDDDYILVPLRPTSAQTLADRLGCVLPTKRIVDGIHAQADVKLTPEPMPPGPAMTTFGVFVQHSRLIKTQLASRADYSPGKLIAGHKKDVVLSNRLTNAPAKVAIYGWHRTNGVPIQPLYTGHTQEWVDYSHGIRLISKVARIEGTNASLEMLLQSPKLHSLVSDEGPLAFLKYPHADTAPSSPEPTTNALGERVHWLTPLPDVRVQVNRLPKPENTNALLIFYALPNGNTIEQTVGKAPVPGEDMRFQIQHIGAQTRFLRRLLPSQEIIVAYLEARDRSWPAWRKRNGDNLIPQLLKGVIQSLHLEHNPRAVLTGHSGGGSLTFGYLNAVEQIPPEVVRIAFLDSNYAYDSSKGHYAKLKQWLVQNPESRLCVLAYDDANALLNGKSFVSAEGGTWGRSQAMLGDFGKDFIFRSTKDVSGLQHHSSLDGRIQFYLKENPDRRIWHTVQVEKNGFIHSMLTGTSSEEKDYKYLADPCYTEFVSP